MNSNVRVVKLNTEDVMKNNLEVFYILIIVCFKEIIYSFK